jgi:hypothetical protein
MALKHSNLTVLAFKNIVHQQLLNDHGKSCTYRPDNGRLSGTSAADASTAMLKARNGHTSTPSLAHTPWCDSDGFVKMSHVSTSGRKLLAGTLAVTQSEHPASRDNQTFGAYRRISAAHIGTARVETRARDGQFCTCDVSDRRAG